LHYLPLIERKVGALDQAAPLRGWDLPGVFATLRRLLEELGDVLYPRSPWLFPTRSNDGRRVIATQVWREKELPSETGHILRHTYRTLAHAAGITETDGRLLLDQKVPGISGVYIQERALFTHLQDQQEHMSHYVMGLCASESQET
jgi:integrase